MEIKLRDGSTTQDPRLGRLALFDPQSKSYPIRQLIHPEAKPITKYWDISICLNQGQEGACTGFAVTHEAASEPVAIPHLTEIDAFGIYNRARQLDEFPGEHSGSSVLAAMKAATERGWYGEYRWAFSLEDLILALGHHGPAVLGINWYESMYDPGSSIGAVSVDGIPVIHKSGPVVGGHAILANGVDVERQFVRLHNSWGPAWGRAGEAMISFNELEDLLNERGEACIPVTRLGA